MPLTPVTPVTRRAAIGLVGGLLGGCARMQPLLRVVGSSPEDPGAPGKMLDRHVRRDFDVAAMTRDQDRILKFQRAEAAYGLVYAPELHRYLGGIVRRLLAKAPVPGLPIRAQVVTSRDWAANVTPPGLMFLPFGLMEGLEDEDQLAFVLGHEISHVLFRHHDSDWLVKSQKHAIALGEMAVAARTAIEGQSARTGALSPAGLTAANAVLAASDKIVAPAWNRDQEDQADLLGTDLMIAAGYNPTAAVEVLEKLAAWRKQAGRPYTEAPRAVLRQGGFPGPQPDRGRTRSGEPGLSAEIQGLWQVLVESLQGVLETLSRPHPDPEQRLERVRQYLYREYRDLPARDASVRSFAAAREHPQTKEVLTHYAYAFEARVRLRERDVRRAQERAEEAAQGFTRSHHFPRYTLADVYARTGRSERVVEHLRAALEAPEPALEAHLRLALLQERVNRPADALAILEGARPRFADHPRTWPDLIRLYRRLGRTQEASQLQLRCQVEFPDFRQLCSGSSRG